MYEKLFEFGGGGANGARVNRLKKPIFFVHTYPYAHDKVITEYREVLPWEISIKKRFGLVLG